MSTVRYFYYPRTKVPPSFADEIAGAFRVNEEEIGTEALEDGLKSDEVLKVLRPDLEALGFSVESGKKKEDLIKRPVLFGKNGEPELRYEVDGYHEGWRCGIEVEAGRAWKGNAVYRDIVQGLMMVQVDTLVLAVPNVYRYGADNQYDNRAFDYTKNVVDTLYATDRFDPPYDLMVLGY